MKPFAYLYVILNRSKWVKKGGSTLGAFGQYAKINPQLITFKDTEWKKMIDSPRSEREHHQIDTDGFSFGQVAARFLGIPHDEDDYYLTLYELSQKPNVEVWSDHLNKEIAPQIFQSLQSVLQVNQSESLSVNRFIAFMEGRQLIPSHQDASLHRYIRESYIEVLNQFAAKHDGGLKHPDFRRVIMDLTKWVWNHINDLLKKMDDVLVPCIIWYGEATKSEQYFLFLTKLLGIDLLIFHPNGGDIFQEFDPEKTLMVVQDFPVKKQPRPFPKSKPVRKATVAYQASKEIDRILHSEETPIFKPWQYRSHLPVSITLKTTYDELFLMSKERAFIRPGFYIEGNEIYIPSVFAKISGVSENRRNYWERVEQLKEGELSLFIRYFPFTNSIKANHKYHYDHALNPDGTLDPEKMIKSVWWRLNQLPTGVQLAIAAGISRVCAQPKLLPEGHESVEDVKQFLFTQLTALPKSVVTLFMKFDYPQQVPRVILYNSGATGGISRSDAALLLLLNEIGIDILLFNPSGLRDLELYIDEHVYDIHLLEQFEFEYEYQEPKLPIWRRLFRKDT